MSELLTGQVALVTGGARGIGRGFAQAMAYAGAAVAITARTESQIDETVKAIKDEGGQAAGWAMQSPVPARGQRKIVANYDYVDEKAQLLFQVVRYDPKSFSQRRPDGNGGWVWNRQGVATVLYRLPELIATPNTEVIFVPEGEKDVDALRHLGVTATCNAGSAGKFTAELCHPLRNRPVVIIQDKDDAGKKHVNQVANQVFEVANSVRVVEMPGDNVKDAWDWIALGGTRDGLISLASQTTQWTPVKPLKEQSDIPRNTNSDSAQTGHGRQGRKLFNELRNVNLVDFASRFTDLRPSGRGCWKGLCPVHQERTPSFFVYENPWRWSCYGACATGGDIVALTKELKNQGKIS